MTKSMNIFPYFDDYDTTKNFHKILFVPGNPVQARELTQIQSILQEQIKRHGDHIFKNGTVVLPGHVYYDPNVVYLKVETSFNGTNIESYSDFLVGKTVKGNTSGVSALVLHVEVSTDTEPTTIFVKYTSANGSQSEFVINETLVETTTNIELSIQAVSDFTGAASLVSIDEGVYYINGYFVGVNKQTIAVSKYSNTDSTVIGLMFVENIVGPSSDSSLYDNSNGFYNYGAPGADRYQIALTLAVKPYGYVDDDTDTDLNFIELLKIKDGNVQFLAEDTEYSQINKMLARRTYDEAGDYVVDDFTFKFKNYRSNNRGQWVASKPYLAGDIVTNGGRYYYNRVDGYSGTTPPTHTYGTLSDGSLFWTQTILPSFNNGIFQDSVSTTVEELLANESKYSLSISSGKAYIRGFEVNVKEPQQLLGSKARDTKQVSNTSLFVPSGEYVIIDNLLGLFNISTIPSLNILDNAGATVGTAYGKSIEYVSGTPGTTTAQYKLFLFGIVMDSGKSFDKNAVSFSGTNFTAKTVLSLKAITGSVSTDISQTWVTGKGTLFQSELAVGGLIRVDGETRVIASITSNVLLNATTNFTTVNTDVAGYSVYADLESNGPSIQKLDNTFIKSVRDSSGNVDTTYTVVRYAQKTSSGGGTITLTLTSSGEYFSSYSALDFIVTTVAGAAVAITTSSPSATSITLNGLAGTTTYNVLYHVTKSGVAASEKMKSLQTKTITVNAANVKDESDTTILTAGSNFTSSAISLTEADIVRIVKITMSGGAVGAAYSATNEVDVTSWFKLDNGQRHDFYDIGSIKRVSNVQVPTKPLKVTFDYFDHSTGDYFSVDSYRGTPYSEIPVVTFGNTRYDLRDCLDFRSRKSDDGTSFTASGASVSEPFNSTTSISTSYSYYLPRVDVLTLSQDGVFSLVQGKSANNPVEPGFSTNELKMLSINVDQYTGSPDNIKFQTVSHKRYTMEDIGKIDNRLKNVEYYVALNELEKKTVNLNITDANGLTRYKNGFFADNFSSYDAAEFTNKDFSASIDFSDNSIGPRVVTNNVHLYEVDGTTLSSRIANGYQVTGSLITLPYSEVVMIDQSMASRSEYINPYSVISFKNTGVATVFPSSDIWTDSRSDYNVTWAAETTQQYSLGWQWIWPYYWSNWYGYYGWYWWNGYQPDGTSTTSTVSTSTTTSTQDVSTMRNRSVAVSLIGMKPLTTFHSFMNDENIDAIVTPAETLRYTGSVTFQGWADTAKSTEHLSERSTSNGSYDSFDYGDVLVFYSGSTPTGATAVVASCETQLNGSSPETVLKIVNRKGTPVAGNTFVGSLSGATGTVVSLTTETAHTTNSTGNFFGVINFTNHYSTGKKTLKFNDDVSGNSINSTTEVQTTYVCHGTLNITTVNETKQKSTIIPVYYWWWWWWW